MVIVRHFGIVVSNLDRALDFYQKFFGFQILSQNVEEGPFINTILGFSGTKVTTVKLGGSLGPLIELLEFDNPGSSKPRSLLQYGPTHIALTVTDLDQIYERMMKANIEIVSPPNRSPEDKVKVMFCRDPDQTWLELVEELR